MNFAILFAAPINHMQDFWSGFFIVCIIIGLIIGAVKGK
jgi:hypothetical protein